jgi:phytoene desaturase
VVRNEEPVIVIGAGPGGLAAAMLLAARGLAVRVIERRDRVGGRTSAIEQDGFRFDMGPTFFLYPQVLEKIFQACGRDLWQEVQLKRLDPQYHLIFEQGGDVRATADLQRMQEQLRKIDPHDAQALPAYLEDNRRKFAAFAPILQRPFDRLRDVLSPSLLPSLTMVRPWASVDRDLHRHFRDQRTRLAFSFQSKYLGMSPFRCPSLFTILAFLEYEFGVYHPIGGCSALCEAMARVAGQMGVDIRLNESVTQLECTGRRVTAVQTDQQTYAASQVVINADFAHAIRRLVPDRLRRRWNDRKLDRAKYSCSTFMMYLGIEGRLDQLEHHTIYLTRDYRQNLIDIEQDHRLSDSPSFYVQNASRTDPTLAPEGMSTLYCLAPVTHEHENVDWTTQTPRFRSIMLRQLERIGVTDLESRIRTERIITPRDWTAQMHIHRGATFNLSHSFDQMLYFRPHNRYEDLEGVYLVGGGTHPGSGLPVIFESARISAELLLADRGKGRAKARSKWFNRTRPMPVAHATPQAGAS